MRRFTKLATGAAAIGLATTGALATLGSGAAAAHVPAVVHLASTNQAAPTQVTPTPAPNSGSNATPDPTGSEAPDTSAEATTAEPANEPAVPGGGHADTAGATADHQFDGIE